MRKRIILLSFLLCVMLFSFTGCSNNLNKSTNTEYEVTLDIENYWKYLDWDKENRVFTGVLVYALYDEVVVTLRRTLSSEYCENTFTEDYEIKLNAAGCKKYDVKEYTYNQIKSLLHYEEAYLGSYRFDYEIIHIAGKVLIFITNN